LEWVGEECSSPTTTPKGSANEHESQLPAEGQLLQILTGMQKWIDAQEVEVAREHEKAALERDVVTRVHDQLLTQIEALRKA